jgi:hypothetical protein
MKLKKISAALAGLSLAWSTAFAQAEPAQAPEPPAVIILEIEAVDPATGEPASVDPQVLGMLVMQLLATLEAEGALRDLPTVAPPRVEPGVGI